VGKNKFARWNEMLSFSNVVQPRIGDVFGKDHPLKGKWKSDFFNNENKIILELGCGRGEYTTGLAMRFPENNYIGVDIKGARLWKGAKTGTENNILNAGFLRTRIEFIHSFFAEDEVDEIWLTFPDPFPKIRDANKRLSGPHFLNLYRLFLKNNGIIHLKTDNLNLFQYTHNLVKFNNLEVISVLRDLSLTDHADEILKIETHYEKLFSRNGLKINYLSFRLGKNNVIEHAKKM
jgi:tRNA (guanine-N7-)-methyltransferase